MRQLELNCYRLGSWRRGTWLALGVIIAVIGCSDKKHPPTRAAALTTQDKGFFVHGNPLQIVSGAQFNSASFLKESNYSEFDGFLLTNKIFFQKKTSRKTRAAPITSAKDLETLAASDDVAASNESPEAFAFLSPSAQKDAKGHLAAIEYANEKQTTRLFFVRNSITDALELATEIQIDGQTLTVRTLHYSVSQDQNMMSFLLYDVKSDALIALFFTRPVHPFEIERTILGDKSFYYLGGAGAKIRWNKSKPLEISICGSNELFDSNGKRKVDLVALYGLALQEWQEALGSSLELQLKIIPQNYPPFSDLNTHCIYLINDYLVSEDNRFLTPAQTFNFNDAYFHFQHAFTMIWSKEYTAKNNKSFYAMFESNEGYRVLLHELGHFLGLDHLPPDANTPSVMTYDAKTTSLTDYDKRAVQYLYSD